MGRDESGELAHAIAFTADVPGHVGEIPVERATKFILALNQTAAKALGVAPSLTFMASVDELIE